MHATSCNDASNDFDTCLIVKGLLPPPPSLIFRVVDLIARSYVCSSKIALLLDGGKSAYINTIIDPTVVGSMLKIIFVCLSFVCCNCMTLIVPYVKHNREMR